VHVIAARSWFGDYIKGVSLTESVASHGIWPFDTQHTFVRITPEKFDKLSPTD
jgi:hypothetical protein